MENYFNIHTWLRINHGKASKCENENCTHKTPKRYEWALIKGKEHKKNRNNYIQLCPSCHRKYDFTEQTRQNLSKAKKGIKAHNKGNDSRFEKKCITCGINYKHYKKTSVCCSKTCAALYREKIKRNGK